MNSRPWIDVISTLTPAGTPLSVVQWPELSTPKYDPGKGMTGQMGNAEVKTLLSVLIGGESRKRTLRTGAHSSSSFTPQLCQEVVGPETGH